MSSIKLLNNPWAPRLSRLSLESALRKVTDELTLFQTSLVGRGKASFNDPLAIVLFGPCKPLPFFTQAAVMCIGNCRDENVRIARINAELHRRLGMTRRDARHVELVDDEQSLSSGMSATDAGVIIGIDSPLDDQLAVDVASFAARRYSEEINTALC